MTAILGNRSTVVKYIILEMVLAGGDIVFDKPKQERYP
jgi:hypothetical protein